ncbi:MAG TPA: hypothetical protein VN736_11235 [Candidatus Limnocylindrales bacterium]|nr:hypothetical protein [Candidatus Limnocylindrales bacterium]
MRSQRAVRIADIAQLIPPPAPDLMLLRSQFTRAVDSLREQYAAGLDRGLTRVRLIAGMYARGCYSMLLVKSRVARIAGRVPLPRVVAISLIAALLRMLPRLAAPDTHYRIACVSTLMATIDPVLDEVAAGGLELALRVPDDPLIRTLIDATRAGESPWRARYWEESVAPAVRDYCAAEALAVAGMPDCAALGHRGAGLQAVVEGMWYAIGPELGFDAPDCRQLQWMADTTRIMQMIDDWVDQDEDRGKRLTPVLNGDWTLADVAGLYGKTVEDLKQLLDDAGVYAPALRNVIVDLYTDYLQLALDAMGGVAA